MYNRRPRPNYVVCGREDTVGTLENVGTRTFFILVGNCSCWSAHSLNAWWRCRNSAFRPTPAPWGGGRRAKDDSAAWLL